MDKADRNYVENLIALARRQTGVAREVAESFGLRDVAERLEWAMDFQDAATVKLGTREPNADGTTGPEHVTNEGRELRGDPVCQCGLPRSWHVGVHADTFREARPE